MSIKFYDKNKDKWEKIATLLASSVKVLDVEGNYESLSVEGCLSEISQALDKKFDHVEYTSDGKLNFYSNDVIVNSVYIATSRSGDISNEIINKMQKQLADHETRIAWLEENGGGGGGQDGNTAPTITTTFDDTSFSLDDSIEIPYFVMDSQGGNFIANYSIDGEVATETVKVGPNTWKVGKLSKGTHVLKLYLKDYALFSNELVFNISVGSLEISSNFREKDYGLSDKIIVNYDIEAIGDNPIQVETILDGKSTIVDAIVGRNTWALGTMQKGPHRISLRAFTSEASSNIITFNFTITDAESLYVSTSFEDKVWDVENRLIIPYRISLMGGSKFKVKYTVNGASQPLSDGVLGMNFWDLGYIGVGTYKLTIEATDISGTMKSNVITLDLKIAATDFNPVLPIEDDLLCWFDAKGKSNSYEDREEWLDKSGNNIKAKLVDVNYSNNGWIKDGLRLNGDAYAEIDITPFKSGVSEYGITVDVEYSYNNSGTDSARVFSCELPVIPGTGISIDSIDINLLGSESINKSPNNEINKIRATFIIDKETNRSYIYVNGVICNTALLSKTESFIHDSKIYLNARRDDHGNIIDISDCTIYNLRVYDRALTPDEVVQNHISDMKIEDQKIAVKRNTFTSLGQIDFDGDFTGMGAEDQVPLRVAFSPNDGPGVKFDYPKVLTDWQGNSSLQYAIKNYNIDLFDEQGQEVKILVKDNWPIQDSYHIKANMVDSSHAFNLGIAKLLSKVYTEPTPGIIQNPDSNVMYGIDGFPVTCFHNGKFHGLYTFNLKQHRDVYGMNKSSTTQFCYRAEENSAMGAAAFRDSSDFSIEQEFEERHPKRPPGTGVKHNEFRRLIDFVKDSSDSAFTRDFTKHFNKNYTLDYYLLCYVLGGIDSLGKNMSLMSWDSSPTTGIWYPMFYDMDTFFGFDNKGELVWGPDVRCPEDYNTSGSLLWERVGKLMQNDIRIRYAQLRRGGLTLETIINTLRGEIIDPIGEKFYNLDAMYKYLTQGATYLYMAKGNRVQHIERWLTARFLYVDSMFEFLPDVQNSIIVRNTCSGLWKIRIKTYTPQLIKVEFGGTGVSGEEPYKGTLTKMCNNKEWTEFSYFFDGVYQRDIAISGAKYIIGLEGIAESETLMLDVSLADKLIEIDAHGNPNLTSLNLENCVRLKRLDVHNCPRLGSTTGTPLDVGNCYNLKYLDISNTAVPAITTTKCSYLTHVDISNSLIASIKYYNLQSLNNLKIENCSRLTSIEIDSCQGVTNLNIKDNPALREIILTNCKNIELLDLTNLKDLRTLTIEDCPGIKTIKVRSCVLLKILDVAGCEALDKLDLAYSNIENLSFGKIANLKTLDLTKNLNLKDLDFGECKSRIDSFKIKDAVNIKTIKNLNLFVNNYEQSDIFRRNDYIQEISGKIEFDSTITSIRDMFNDCVDLIKTPQLILNDVTVISGLFSGCSRLYNIDLFDTSKVTDMSYMFRNCIALETIPEFNTSKVTSFDGVFSGCKALSTVPKFDISSAVSLRSFFKECHSLTEIPEIVTTKVTDFSEMFMDCISLEYIPTLDVSNATNLSYFLDGCVKLRSLPALNTGKVTNFTRAFSRCEYLSFIPAFNTSNGTNLSYMYYGNINATTIEDIDTTKALNVAGLFESCYKLANIPAMDTSKATNFNSLFRSCYSLVTAPDVNTSNADDIGYMYWDCRKLKTIQRLNTTKLTKMSELFYGCVELLAIPEMYTTDEEMDSPTQNVTDMRGLFNGCRKVSSLPEIDTRNVTDLSEMFRDCTSISQFPAIDVTKAKMASELFSNCSQVANIPVVTTTDGSKPFSKCNILYGLFRNCTSLEQVPVMDTTMAEDVSGMFENCKNLKQVPELNTSKVVYISQMFRGCESLTSIPDIDTSSLEEIAYAIFENCKNITVAPKLLNSSKKIKDLSYLFKGCIKLTTVEGFSIGNATIINEMFRGCIALRNIPVFDTSNVTNMTGIFNECSIISEIPNTFNTSNAKVLNNAFNGCTALSVIPALDLSSATILDSMFASCINLRTVPLMNTAKVNTFDNMFSGCKLLSSVPKFDMSSATSVTNMFRNCSALVSIPDFDTSKIVTMSEMLRECISLKVIPTSINTTSAKNTYGLFYGCTSITELHTLDLGSVVSSSNYSDRMIEGCSELTTCSFINNKVQFSVSGFDKLRSVKFLNTARGVNLFVTNNSQLDVVAIDAMFEALSTVEKGTINISGCAGVYGCNTTIAEAKGWTVIVDFSIDHPLRRYTK